jgi:hypothetical protein
MRGIHRIWGAAFLPLLLWFVPAANAMEPPEDEAAVGYNFYDGGGVTVHGPAVIVQKEMAHRLALKASSRIDLISSASVDVVTQASPYSEERVESSLGFSLIRNEFLMGIQYTHSSEDDYKSNSLSASLSHDLFDQNLTFNLRYARSWDDLNRNGDPAFGWRNLDRTIFTAGFSRILSPRWLLQLNYEGTADSGFLNNPYRSALTLDGGTVPENYPEARTGHAWLIRTVYGFFKDPRDAGEFPDRKSLQLDYRHYRDSFGVQSHLGKALFQRYWGPRWIGGVFYQYHRQTEASFYGDRLPSDQIFKARDKELSRFSDHWIGAQVKYRPEGWRNGRIENPFIEFGYSFILFDYENFTDPRTGELYNQESHVIHTSIGFNY